MAKRAYDQMDICQNGQYSKESMVKLAEGKKGQGAQGTSITRADSHQSRRPVGVKPKGGNDTKGAMTKNDNSPKRADCKKGQLPK